jgi:hypothetical protein
MIPQPRWPFARRLLFGAAGLVLALLSLMLGATIAAGGGVTERPGGVITLALLVLTLLGLFVAAAGAWGAWSPGTNTRLRVRSIRVVLIWAFLVGGYMCWSLPLSSPASMTRAEWISAIVLGTLLTIVAAALIGVTRRPGVVVALLGAGAAYGGYIAFRVAAVLLTPLASRYSGPARTLSLLMAGSFSLALVAAFILSWPLRSTTDARNLT